VFDNRTHTVVVKDSETVSKRQSQLFCTVEVNDTHDAAVLRFDQQLS